MSFEDAVAAIAAQSDDRTQLFCYLKSCGREELSTIHLWGGMNAPPPKAKA